ncbi:uncharacterized protein LOC123011749 [Tribolium madens]|uniref:uncharacterized protein LOC123011749 n=1 Tax=Tribolium madens TaxID=41895 RepID=UPI001CF72222|nr:uncharacterized protein LOC123011749 [Tribolium madens]
MTFTIEIFTAIGAKNIQKLLKKEMFSEDLVSMCGVWHFSASIVRGAHSKKKHHGRKHFYGSGPTKPEILDAVEKDPSLRIRKVAHRVGVSSFTVHRTLHEQGLHPYHLQRVQALQPEDPARRLVFAQWLSQKLDEEPNFLRNVLFTDEAIFTRDGISNRHNTHIWADKNSHQVYEHHFQDRFSLNVWADIIDDHLIGSHVLPQRLTGAAYLDFLENVLDDLLEDVPLAIRRNMWYMQDGAPPHYARVVTNWLNNHFLEKWIGRQGPVAWPPRSPDLNPCDFFCGVT